MDTAATARLILSAFSAISRATREPAWARRYLVNAVATLRMVREKVGDQYLVELTNTISAAEHGLSSNDIADVQAQANAAWKCLRPVLLAAEMVSGTIRVLEWAD